MVAAPAAVRAIRKKDPHGTLLAGHDLSALRYLFLVGERLDPQTYRWATDLLGVPVIDHWWQTETGWPMVANPAGIEVLPMKPGSPTRPLPGWDVRILTADGTPAPAGQDGAIVIKLPMPPGALLTLWNDDERFVRSYLSAFPGYYLTGDGGHIDADGYLYVLGRTDDVINVAGNQLSPGDMEDVLSAHPDVAECAVFGVADTMKGQIPRGLVVLHSDVPTDEASQARLCADLVQMVREQIGAVTGIRQVDVVAALPRTRSGKILRKIMAASPTAATRWFRPPSRTPRCWTRSARCCTRNRPSPCPVPTGGRPWGDRYTRRIRHSAATTGALGHAQRQTATPTGKPSRAIPVRALIDRRAGRPYSGRCLAANNAAWVRCCSPSLASMLET